MSEPASAPACLNPLGYEISPALLDEFERGLDLIHPQASRIPCKVIGWGEISTVFEIQAPGLEGLVFKRMSCFEAASELEPYIAAYLEYNRVLVHEVGLRLPPYGYARAASRSGRPVFYIIQEKQKAASVGNQALSFLSPRQQIQLFTLILSELGKVWRCNQDHPDCQVGIDGQISNWAIEDFSLEKPWLYEDARLSYFDTSTPFLRFSGIEQLNPELFLRSAPPALSWILRRLFLKEVVDRYYDPRKVIIDLIANFYKEQHPGLVPDLVMNANRYLLKQGEHLALEPLQVKEVRAYYQEDQTIWSLYLSFRRFDRFTRTRFFKREYPYLLPGKIRR